LADVFGVPIDFLVNGNMDNKATSALKDALLLQHLKAIEKMNESDKNVVLQLIDAFIFKKQIQNLAS